jgi:predicted transposase/invertase (TIGR01784 family)
MSTSMRPVFADPKTDFVFQRIFGTEDHKVALIGFLNDILENDEAHRVLSVTFLPPEQRPKVPELKYSVVDVKCVDARGTTYVVEMQVLNVEAFEKRVVYNVAKAYTNQLARGETYPELNDVIGISICDFELWPRSQGSKVPMLSRWHLHEQATGTQGLSALSFVFMELPKYGAGSEPVSLVDKWAYFFREADNLAVIPPVLQHPPLIEAMEAARTTAFTHEEWDAYIAAGMAIQNERGALSLAQKEGRQEGRQEGRHEGRREGLREAVLDMCELLAILPTEEQRRTLDGLGLDELTALREAIKLHRRWP